MIERGHLGGTFSSCSSKL